MLKQNWYYLAFGFGVHISMSIMGCNQLWAFITAITLMIAIEFNKLSSKTFKYSNEDYTNAICRIIFCIGGTFVSAIIIEIFKFIRTLLS